jgi:hypothetical protein
VSIIVPDQRIILDIKAWLKGGRRAVANQMAGMAAMRAFFRRNGRFVPMRHRFRGQGDL